MIAKVMMYCILNHKACPVAEQYLEAISVTDLEITWVNRDRFAMAEMWTSAERKTLPQIFVGDIHIGSLNNTVELKYI